MLRHLALAAFLICPATLSAQGFEFTKQADPLTDQDRSFVATPSVDGKSAFGWKCDADGLNVLFLFNRYLMGEDSRIPVLYRFPPEKAHGPTSWIMATGHRAAFLPMRQVPAFTATALTSKTVVLRVTDRDGDTITAEFKLDGLADELPKLSCAAPVLAKLP